MEIVFLHPALRKPETVSFCHGIQPTYISIYIQKYIIIETKQSIIESFIYSDRSVIIPLQLEVTICDLKFINYKMEHLGWAF
jgi:hypothetical protein